jgi:hypothetical protein
LLGWAQGASPASQPRIRPTRSAAVKHRRQKRKKNLRKTDYPPH